MGTSDSIQLFLAYALELAILVPTAVIAFIPVHRYLRRGPVWTYVMCALGTLVYIAVGALVCARYSLPSFSLLLISTPFLFVVYALLVDISPKKTLCCFLFAVLLGAFSTVFVKYLLAPMQVDTKSGPTLPLLSLAAIFIEAAMGVVFYDSLSKRLPTLLVEEGLGSSWTYASLALLLLLLLIVWASPTDYGILMEGRVRPIAISALAIFPVACLFLFDVIWTLAARLLENAKLKQENSMLLMEERRYGQLRDYMDKTRKMRHDFRQHLRVIDNLARQDRKDELLAYLDQLGESTGEGNRQLCANHAVDAVASFYDAEAKQQDTVIEWSLHIPEGVFVKEVELCALMGNLIENALQAVAKLTPERREVRVTAAMMSAAMLAISVKNPYEGEVKFGRDGLPTTHKSGHGIGLGSVAATVKRYDGSMDIEADNGVFSVSILMYAPAE